MYYAELVMIIFIYLIIIIILSYSSILYGTFLTIKEKIVIIVMVEIKQSNEEKFSKPMHFMYLVVVVMVIMES